MQRILIVKTSSMGDVIHNLPVIADLHAAFGAGQITIDWVVEEAYAELPQMHSGVARVLPVALRRWRKSWFSRSVCRERDHFRSQLREFPYDAVLDTQGLLKSALLARAARLTPDGVRIGAAWGSAREPLAALFYQRRYPVDARLHAVERLRSLAAQAFEYQVEGLPTFGLRMPPAQFPWLQHADYAVLLHATSRAEKTWPVKRWATLGAQFAAAGIHAVLPWGSAAEQIAARALADTIPGALVAPRLTLAKAAALMAGARAVVGVDTGLTHLAATLDVPVVALFGATARWRFAPYWSARAVSLGDAGVQPEAAAVVAALQELAVLP